MNLESALQFGSTYVSEYVDVLISTLVKPSARFAPMESTDATLLFGSTATGPRLNPRLFVFAIISIFIGATLNAMLPGRDRVPELVAELILAVVAWVFYGTFVHLFCRTIGGTAQYVDTMSVILQVLATIYVVTALLSLVASAALGTAMKWDDGTFAAEYFQTAITVTLHFAISTALVVIYVPLAVRRVHGFGVLRTVIAAAPTLAIVWWVLATLLERATGGFDAVV